MILGEITVDGKLEEKWKEKFTLDIDTFFTAFNSMTSLHIYSTKSYVFTAYSCYVLPIGLLSNWMKNH